MSRIYFHSMDGEAEVRGSERAYFGMMLNNLSLAVLEPRTFWKELKSVIPSNSYLARAQDANQFERDFNLWFSVSMFSEGLNINGKNANPFEIGLNTAFAMGNDAIKLAARIHGQCEIHCFVEGKNRKWLAKIIQEALKKNIYRTDQGWESTIDFLVSSKESPVVLSYSVCDQFPNPGAAHYQDDDDNEGWYKLPDEKRWEMAMAGIRKERGLEIKPQNWNRFYFNDGISAFDIVKQITNIDEPMEGEKK